jgi:hypothetical protein
MSTKTTFKRIALVAVAALGLGMLSVATPANAAVSQSLVASVGPNGETSVTLIGADSNTAGVLVRLDVTSNDSSTVGLQANETITASVVGVPSSTTSKTLAANGGSMVDKIESHIKKTISESETDYIEPMRNRKYYSSYSQAFKRLNLVAGELNRLNENEEGVSLYGEQKKFTLKTPRPEPSVEVPAPVAPPTPLFVLEICVTTPLNFRLV